MLKKHATERGSITVQFPYLMISDFLFLPPILFAEFVLTRTVGESQYLVDTHVLAPETHYQITELLINLIVKSVQYSIP